ncbi:hypothetical protein GTA08_BOTSDO05995 [Neofusicoccum parvum]|uniref:Uncharacterized protein n=1 Tax=Neofusicoccum parvum TaxID=310453 RepID=A0ACB5SIC4_9PEZI|nr:hypothetical protein GTA08_BOTSDO05995 [Neofusicoccum parvum]
MHGLLQTALLALTATLSAAAPTTVAADGKTFNIWADYSRCERADALTLQILDFDAPSSQPNPTAARQTTGEDLWSVAGPWHGSITLLEPGRMGPYAQQSLELRLWAADDAGEAGVFGNATFRPGAEVRNWDNVKWGSEDGALYPDEGDEGTQAVEGKAGSVVTRVSGDSLFLDWCTK